MPRTAEDLLQELMALDESQRIEAKRCLQIDRSEMGSICAFANEPGLGGGHLLLGVERDGQDLFNNAYRVVGVAQPDKLQADLATGAAADLAAGEMVTGLGPDSHQPGADSRQWLATIPADLRAPRPAAGTKPSREVLRALILELWTMRALNRTEHKPLVRDYPSPMGKGSLSCTVP